MRGAGFAVCAAAVLAAVTVARADAHAGPPRWPLAKLMKRIEGAPVRVGRWHGRVHVESTLCSGDGAARRWSGVSHWRHFTCTWTTFTGSGFVARDVTFRVHTLSRTRFVITDAHFGAS